MRAVYSDRYRIDIGTHVFPTIKYQLVQRALAATGGFEFVEPEPAAWKDLALVHTDEYLHQLKEGEFSLEELMQLELPWSPEVVEGFRLMTGGTLLAARDAVGQGFSPANERVSPGNDPGLGLGLHIGGGLHHAFANHGEGFCLFNDVAVAIRVLQRDGLIRRAAIVDCDVHHGNGTAMIFDGDPAVFTFSIHQQHNYPMFKPRSALDIGLDDRVGDEVYLAKLRGALPKVMASKPDIVFYLAGADPYEDDQLGGLSLTQEGLRERDRLVFTTCRDGNVPVVVTLAGGYARRVGDTVAIHASTFAEAVQAFDACRG